MWWAGEEGAGVFGYGRLSRLCIDIILEIIYRTTGKLRNNDTPSSMSYRSHTRRTYVSKPSVM
jgi:hypothetical protein